MNNQQPCSQEDLQGYVLQSVLVELTDDGRGDFVIDRCELDLESVDEYYCNNCQRYWRVADRYNTRSRAEAYRAAIRHLTEDAEAGRAA